MRKYNRKPRKTRSNAQKAQVLTLAAIRLKRQAERQSGGAPSDSSTNNQNSGQYTTHTVSLRVVQLQNELDLTKRKLKNSLQREKRTKAAVIQKSAELSTLHHKLAECEDTIIASQIQLEQPTVATDGKLGPLQNYPMLGA